MKGRFNAALRDMRLPKSAARRRNEGLAERVASKLVHRDWKPELWAIYFNAAVQAAEEFFADYPEAL